MAKKRVAKVGVVLLDRTLLVGIILMALAYIMRGSWVGVFCEAAGFAVAVVWSYRAMVTNPHREFRLAALLVFVLTVLLLSFYLASGQGVV